MQELTPAVGLASSERSSALGPYFDKMSIFLSLLEETFPFHLFLEILGYFETRENYLC